GASCAPSHDSLPPDRPRAGQSRLGGGLARRAIPTMASFSTPSSSRRRDPTSRASSCRSLNAVLRVGATRARMIALAFGALMAMSLASVQVTGFGDPIRLTCRIGVAASDTLGVWGEHLIARADEAVYAAKRSGRNQ